MRGVALLLTLMLFVACEGPVGPAGPEGPEGPAGPGTRVTFSGQLDTNGEAWVELPMEAGDSEDLPLVDVYITNDPARETWYAVADGDATNEWPWFGVLQHDDHLDVYISGSSSYAKRHYQMVVAY